MENKPTRLESILMDNGYTAINTAFIVRAVNAHEELLSACTQAMKALEHWGNVAPNIESANDPVRLDAHGKLWDAIAKADGGNV